MATKEDLRQRFKDDPDNTGDVSRGGGGGEKRQARTATARSGLRSLAVAVAVPVALHLAVFFSTHGTATDSAVKDRVFLPPWMLHAICVAEAALMGLSSWLIWAAGGFHKKPSALALYLGYLGLSLAWDPVVFGKGWVWAGLPVSVGMFGTLAGCVQPFREVNPIAGDMVKLCLIWAAFVVCLNLKLAYW